MTFGQGKVLRKKECLKMMFFKGKYTFKLLMDRHLINTPFCAVNE